MDNDSPPRAFGVFKPIGHVVVSLPPNVDLEKVSAALADAGVGRSEMTQYTADEMKRQIDLDMQQAGFLASIGQEMNLVKAHRELAEKGYGWLVVKPSNDDQARMIADVSSTFGARRAQHYGRFVIEELLDYGNEPVQSPESPDTGLDRAADAEQRASSPDRADEESWLSPDTPKRDNG